MGLFFFNLHFFFCLRSRKFC